MEQFLSPLSALVSTHPPVEIISTEPQDGRYPGVNQPLSGINHIENPSIAVQSFTKDTELILVIGSLYLCGNILSYLGLDADIV